MTQTMTPQMFARPMGAEAVKSCCTTLYESDIARLLMGDSFHPGGVKLSERLGALIELTPKTHLIDIASGKGTTAFALAKKFGCRVSGVDLSRQNVDIATQSAASQGLADRVTFHVGDAESLPFAAESFDALICECAFCTFPDKVKAASEMARVLRPSGWLGLSDMTRGEILPPSLDGLLSWVACIADAQTTQSYQAYLTQAGLNLVAVEQHGEALSEMVHQVKGRLLTAEIMAKLQKVLLDPSNLATIKEGAKEVEVQVASGNLGYALITARK